MAREEGFEPSVSCFKGKRLYRFVHSRLAASSGPEPELLAPETSVLPLDDKASKNTALAVFGFMHIW